MPQTAPHREVILSGLNPQQRAAVSAPMDRHIKVVAGAGTGKTSVLTQRIAWLVAHGVAPWHITAVTFTNKAAKEMRERLTRSIGEEKASRVQMGTFHGLGRSIIKRHHAVMGLEKHFPIIDRKEQEALMARVVRDLLGGGSSKAIETRHRENPQGEKGRDGGIRLAKWQETEIAEQRKVEKDLAEKHLQKIADWKQRGKYPPPNEIPKGTMPHIAETLRAYARYETEKKKHGGLDFDDLITRVNHLFSQRPEILAMEQSRIRAMLCDEFQDVNDEQARFIRYLSGTMANGVTASAQPASLFIVGDEDQSIYGWRGSKPEMMRIFGDALGMADFKLERNYRCSPVVLDAANAVIRNNPDREDKTLFTERPDDAPIALFHGEDQRDEARWIADAMQEIARTRKGAYGDIAVLYRSKSAAAGLTRELVHRGIPYNVFGDVGFYGATEVKDAIAWLRLVFNPNDNDALRRAVQSPPCGIGAKTMDGLEETSEITGESLVAAMRRSARAQTSGKRPLSAFLEKIDRLRNDCREMPFGDFVLPCLNRGMTVGDGSVGMSLLEQQEKDGERGEARKENLMFLAALAASHASNMEMNDRQGRAPDAFDFDALDDSSVSMPAANAGREPEDVLAEFLAEMALMTAAETADAGERDAVSFMTIHKSKGLEFPHVFVMGCVDGMFPSRRQNDPMGTCENLEEERRLFYVAVTRAKQGLFLSASKSPMTFGDAYRGTFPLSPFVQEIPERLRTEDVFEVVNRLPERRPEDLPVPAKEPRRPSSASKAEDAGRESFVLAEEPPPWLDEPPPVDDEIFLPEASFERESIDDFSVF